MRHPIETFCTWYLSRRHRVEPVVIETAKAKREREYAEHMDNSLGLGMMKEWHRPFSPSEVMGLSKLGPKAILRNSVGVPIETVTLEPVYVPPGATEETPYYV